MRGRPSVHGLRNHPLYGVWRTIKSRCYNKNYRGYPAYGGKGVTMCAEWLNDPKAFIDWAIQNGWKQGLVIDKDLKSSELKVYSPATCAVLEVMENIKISTSRTAKVLPGNCKLTVADIAAIKVLRADGKLLREIAPQFNVSIPTLCRVLNA